LHFFFFPYTFLGRAIPPGSTVRALAPLFPLCKTLSYLIPYLCCCMAGGDSFCESFLRTFPARFVLVYCTLGKPLCPWDGPFSFLPPWQARGRYAVFPPIVLPFDFGCLSLVCRAMECLCFPTPFPLHYHLPISHLDSVGLRVRFFWSVASASCSSLTFFFPRPRLTLGIEPGFARPAAALALPALCLALPPSPG